MVKILNFILISHTTQNYSPVFLYFIKTFFAIEAKTLLFLQSSFPLFYALFMVCKYKYKYKNLNQQPIYFKHFSNNDLNYVTQLFDDTGNTKELVKSKREFNLNNYFYFKWMQLIHSIPQKWQNTIKNKIKHGLKGTLMQIWKSANIFVFIWK